MKKLITIVALTASVIATPAFAQSFDRDFRIGNGSPSGYESTGFLYNNAANPQYGLRVYGMVPGGYYDMVPGGYYDMAPGGPWSSYGHGGVVTGGVQPLH